MQSIDGTLVHSASDLNDFGECLHLTALERGVAERTRVRPTREDPTADLLRRKGDEHERRHLERLRAIYGERLVAFEARPHNSLAGYRAAEAESVAAMAAGAEVIFQATFFDGTFLGRADFLRKVASPSRFGDFGYEVVDTKLALSPKPYFLVQLCNYSEHLERIQGVAPRDAEIVLGTGVERRFRVDQFSAYYRALKRAYLASVASGADAYPFECAHCDLCAWRDLCAKRRDDDDHLSIVANIRRDQVAKLEKASLPTVAALASASDAACPRDLNAETFARLRAQAAEQDRYRSARPDAEHTYSFREAGVPSDAEAAKTFGFARLPEPAPGDVFFDMEGDPMFAPGRALEYLFGVYTSDDDAYVPFWGCDPAQERVAFERFVDFVTERRTRYPNLHVYHYAPYETSALKRLMGRFGSRENEIDAFLRAGTFVDLYPIVTQSVVISQPSYSIKKLEALYGFTRSTTTRAGDDSIVMFESWLENGDDATLEDIRAYNEDDCRSTHALRQWLLRVRDERNATLATPIPWRAAILSDPADDRIERGDLEARLLAGISPPGSLEELREFSDDRRTRWLLGNLVQYHRRAQKPEWWEHFHRIENASELIDEDRKALGGLEILRDVLPCKQKERDKSHVYTYRYPEQEHDMSVGDKPLDVLTKKASEIVSLDEASFTIRLKVSDKNDEAAIRDLIPGKPLDVKDQREALEYVARAYDERRLDELHPATLALVERRLPRLDDRPLGATIQPGDVSPEALSRVVRALDGSYLVVQGPPGSGKSTKGAHVIVDLLEAGKRVALAANSHKALHGLLHKIEENATKRGVVFSGCHKSSNTNVDSPYESKCGTPLVEDASEWSGGAACNLVSATNYSWARAKAAHRGAFDVVVVDEAGQVSLADALIVSLVARNVVLLGDPQQLPQVAQGSHPIGTDRSILEHLLDDAATVPPERGVFLDVSYRMHPTIDRFVSDAFYDGRLEADPANARSAIDGTPLAGAGLRFVPVAHDGHRRRSREEAETIAVAIEALLRGGRVTVRDERERPITARDVLVVAPYNQQRREIAERLHARGIDDVAVGTVDKFQGQEAPVVFYSLATSRAELAPRGLDFLLDPNRFNVAVSRAQALAVVVASPHLLASRATTIDQMRQLNLLCAYAERAATPLPL